MSGYYYEERLLYERRTTERSEVGGKTIEKAPKLPQGMDDNKPLLVTTLSRPKRVVVVMIAFMLRRE